MENSSYLKEQLITYLGNKRSLLNFINNVVLVVKEELGKERIVTFDGFSGSGCVARYLKQHSTLIITNDLEKYSFIINDSFLKNKSEVDFDRINEYVVLLNEKKHRTDLGVGIIERLYSPKDTKNPQPGERCFYTNENAKIIDNIRRTIELEIPDEYKNTFISILLHEASVHANTSGVFKGFYKGLKSDRGKFGGEKENALERILGEINIKSIILSNFDSERRLHQKNTNDLVKELDVDIDLTYYDPPYNQHPYGSNYHVLNTIVDYVEPQELSDVAGIPKNWNKSDYNKKAAACKSFDDLIQNTKSKYIMISYNSEGFISYDEMMEICNKKGETRVYDELYNVFRGSRNLKDRDNKVTEFIFLIKSN